jgi:hypothetical protein
VVVTEWQLDLDAHLETRTLPATDLIESRSDPVPRAFALDEVPRWLRVPVEREDAHVALDLDPAVEGVGGP